MQVPEFDQLKNLMPIKMCSKCGREASISVFHRKYGFAPECRDCYQQKDEEEMIPKGKSVKYAPIPKFNQLTQAIFQEGYVDWGNYIELGVVVIDLPPKTKKKSGLREKIIFKEDDLQWQEIQTYKPLKLTLTAKYWPTLKVQAR